MKSLTLATLLTGLAFSSGAAAIVETPAGANFDDLSLAPNSYFFPQQTTTFVSGGATFNHSYTEYFPGCCHTDWVYSNMTDTTTAGYTNQHSAITGGGALGSSNYGIAYMGAPTVTFAGPATVSGAYFTNTTYAALSMRDGDSFAKKFGGATGNDADWFKLTIQGRDAANALTGSVDFYLADFRFADNNQDYILNTWAYVDLSSLGTVNSLSFVLDSSDVGQFGMNTPAYFAMDNLNVAAVPEPETYALFLGGLALVSLAVRRRNAV